MGKQYRAKRVFLINWDALRPDMIDRQLTPNLYSLTMKGVFCENHHAVFPSCTRVNIASIVTGSYPDKHGIMANCVYMPEINTSKVLPNDDHRVFEALDKITNGRLLFVDTLTQILKREDKGTVIVSMGSAGGAYLFDHKRQGLVVNNYIILPESRSEDILGKYGPVPTQQIPRCNLNDYMLNVFLDCALSDNFPRFAVLWMGDPDFTQHQFGIGSHENLAALQANDCNLGRLLKKLEEAGILDETDIFVTSDHGASTIVEKISVSKALIEAGLKEEEDSTDVVVASSGSCILIYVKDHDGKKIGTIVEYLQQQKWAGAIFTHGLTGVDGIVPGTMSMAFIRNQNDRSADIIISLNVDSGVNAHGIVGTTVADHKYPIGRAMHGNFGYYDIHNTLIAIGPDFRSGVRNMVPSGVIDIAPTILSILGVVSKHGMDGRILNELFVDGPHPTEMFWHQKWEEVSANINGTRFVQALQYSTVDKTTYFDKVLVNRSRIQIAGSN